ncbi:RNA-directed DNA polymerase, partial [Flavobacteriales bacterium]|nr:RNA-directed DNA polymerase [Flavobacteriales bacterium]
MSKDQVGIRAFGDDLKGNCDRLSEKILKGEFTPSRGFKYYMPKASRTHRTRTVLFIEDALVYQAIANRIAEAQYDNVSQYDSFVFGSVLSPNVKKGLSILEEEDPEYFFFQFWKSLFKKFKDSVIHSIEVDKVAYKFETDITGFFDCIPHYNLLQTLSSSFNVEDEILDILSECFNRWSGTKDSYTPGVGIPQGPVPSYLFANLLLHDLDKKIVGKGFSYYRYMDDISIYGYKEEEMLESLVTIDNYLKGNGLSLNSKKTSVEKIDHSVEDEKVKTLKKFKSFSFYGSEEDIVEAPKPKKPNPTKKIDTELNKLSEQDQSRMNFGLPVVETIVDKEDIIK